MNVEQKFEAAMSRIHSTTWGRRSDGMWDSNAPACLLAALGDSYQVTEATERLAAEILKDCPNCVSRGSFNAADVVWLHNDRCLESQEDALLLLKKAAHA